MKSFFAPMPHPDFSNYRYGVLFLMFLIFSAKIGRSQVFEFNELSAQVGEGLVFDILQDERGFMWFGTEYGLIRYDGYEEKVYQNDPGNRNSLAGNVVTCILEDEKGGLWLGTMYNGLQYFDPRREHFQSVLPSLSGLNFNALEMDQDGYIWGATEGAGLIRLDASTGTFNHFTAQPWGEGAGLSSNNVHDLHQDRDGVLWIATYKALLRWDPMEEQFTSYDQLFRSDTLNHVIQTLSENELGQLWLGTRGGQVFVFSKEEEIFRKIDIPAARSELRGGQRVWEMIHRPGGQLWIGRDNGFQVALIQDSEIRSTHWFNGPSNFRVLSLWGEGGALCWVGTAKGVRKIDAGKKKFNLVQATVQMKDSLYHPGITAFTRQDSIRIWVGTTQGLFLYNSREGRFDRRWMQDRGIPFFDGKNIAALYVDQQSRLWVGTILKFNEGFEMWRIDLVSGRAEDLSDRVLAFKRSVSNSVIEDNRGDVWIGNVLGLIRYRPETDHFRWYQPKGNWHGSLPDARVNKVFKDREGRLWIGTNAAGLVLYEPKGDRFTVAGKGAEDGRKITNNRINDIAEDAQGHLWLATPGGLNRFDIQKKEFDHSTKKDGLPDNTLTSLQWSKDSSLWIGTKNGLARYFPLTGTFEVFQVQDGLQDKEFWHRSAFLDGRGRLYFGGEAGMNIFHPDSLKYNTQAPPVFLTSFSLFNEPVSVGDKTGILEQDISYVEELVLEHSQNVITLGYTALNYRNPEENRFAYQLEGFDNGWQYIDNKREVTFTNLNPGTYIFRVKASNDDGIWNETGTSLRLVIRPPWWDTWWAWFIFLGVAGALIYLYVRLRWQQQLARQESLRLQEIDALKTELYTNITHEFRTPLTLILGPVEKAIANVSKISGRELNVIRRNGRRLLTLVNQMLQLRRLENGVETPVYRHGDVLPMLRYAVDSFESAARTKRITLDLEVPEEAIFMDYDRERLLDILVNLLSNALKYTPPGGRIRLAASEENGEEGPYLYLWVTDNGIGIPEEEIPKIFDRFHRVRRDEGRGAPVKDGTGIGLALTHRIVMLLEGTIDVTSKSGEGSVFHLRLPIRHAAPADGNVFTDEKLAEGDEIFEDANGQLPGLVSPSARILVVEDNQEVAKFIAACLPAGTAMEIASNGQAGLDRALEGIPDLIISDVMMPFLDGFELTRRLKQDDRSSHIPVILLTARADDHGRLEGLKGGADAYLVKPFNPEELVVRIEKLLEGRRRLQAHYLREAGMGWILSPNCTPSERENAFLKKVGCIVEKFMDDPSFTIEQLSREMGMSHTQLHRKMTALTGESAIKFVRGLRLAKAQQLLLKTDLNIAEVAFQTGFNDPAYFSRVFSGEVGCTPSAFRKSHGGKSISQ